MASAPSQTTAPYDLAVAYRIYPRISRTPPCYSTDKFQLASFCLRSFKEGLGSLRAKVWVLLDGCPPEYRELFLQHFDARDLVLMDLNGVGNLGTFGMQVDLLSQQSESENVYFAEDDYFYFPGALEEMLGYRQARPSIDFVTAYDHLDYYTSPIHQIPLGAEESNGRTWRRVGSSCLTFLTTREVLRKTAPIFKTYGDHNTDLGLWLSVTRHPALYPSGIVSIALNQPGLLRFLVQSWWHNFSQNASGKRWTLAVPAPTIAAHMERHFMPPGFDWDRVLAEASERWSMPPTRPIQTPS